MLGGRLTLAEQMTTASRALYDLTVSPPRLIGVVGVDLLMEDIIEVEPNYALQLEILKGRSFSCPALNISVCELKTLRQTNYADSDAILTGGLCGNEPASCPIPVVQCDQGSGLLATPTQQTLCSGVDRQSYEEEASPITCLC